MNTNINLLEDKKTKRGPISSRSTQILRYVGIVLLFFVSASSIILFILISLSPLPNLKIQERQVNSALSQSHTDMAKLFLINERTDVATMILANRKSYDRSLELIQSILPNGVDVEGLTIEKNTLSLTVSSQSLALLNTFVSSLTGAVTEKKVFSQLALGNFLIETAKNRYLVTLTLLLL